MRTCLFRLLPVALLALSFHSAAAAAGAPVCPAPEGPNAAPVYPPHLAKAGVGGTTVVQVRLDACNRVLEAGVRRSSGHRELDIAALDAVRGWRIEHARERGAPAADGSTLGLVPVVFSVPPEDVPDAALEAVLARTWCDTRVADRSFPGDVAPGYIEDAQPIRGRFQDVLAQVLRDAQAPAQDVAEGVRRYRVDRDGRSEVWDVVEGGWPFAPAIVRIRFVHDSTRGYFATSTLCDGPHCGELTALARELHPTSQSWLPPRPPLPPGRSCD